MSIYIIICVDRGMKYYDFLHPSRQIKEELTCWMEDVRAQIAVHLKKRNITDILMTSYTTT